MCLIQVNVYNPSYYMRFYISLSLATITTDWESNLWALCQQVYVLIEPV